MKYVLLHPATFSTAPIAAALETEEIESRVIETSDELTVAGVPTAIVLDPAGRSLFTTDELEHFANAGGGVVIVGAPDEHDVPEHLPDSMIAAFIPQSHGPRQLLVALRTAYREAAARAESSRARREAGYRTREIAELTRIGMALTTERDLDTLLDLILSQARQITASDAASLYLVESLDSRERCLRFKLSQNFSR